MNKEFEAEVPEAMPMGDEPMKSMKKKFKANTYSVGTIWMNTDDAKKLRLKSGDMVVVENPLKNLQRQGVCFRRNTARSQ